MRKVNNIIIDHLLEGKNKNFFIPCTNKCDNQETNGSKRLIEG